MCRETQERDRTGGGEGVGVGVGWRGLGLYLSGLRAGSGSTGRSGVVERRAAGMD